MSRNHRNLQVFTIADELVADVYRATARFPIEERFGLQAQIRRGCVSVPTNIVEGCARRSTRDYLHFVTIALASACETRYLIEVAHRLEMLSDDSFEALEPRYGQLVRQLQKLVDVLGNEP